MSCPFYARAMVIDKFGRLATTAVLHPVSTLIENPGSNRCALITSAHSPCWMEVGEDRAPDWAECPRNPEFVTEVIRSEAATKRFNAHLDHLDYLRTQRVIADIVKPRV